MSRGLIYLDYAATTPMDGKVLEAMIPYFCEIFSNPSSKHSCGRKAAKAVQESRVTMADLLGASSPSEIVFTSGASEANNLAIKGFAEQFEEPKHFITTSIEHKATLNAMDDLREWGHRTTAVSPGSDGVVNPLSIIDAIESDTVLVSCMLVNNEIGTIQPIDDIADICHDRGICFHTDATQGFGKLPLKVGKNIDMLSLSAHKFYGPKGAGALYVSDRIGKGLKCQISGGSQEGGLRAGTLNVPGIVGMAAAAKLSCGRISEEWDRLKGLEGLFLGLIRKTIPMAYLQGNAGKVPWINNICFYGADAGLIRDGLGEMDICVSRTSACSETGGSSHVLEAIGTDEVLQSGAIRFSFGSRTNEEKIRIAAAALSDIVGQIRGANDNR